MAHWHSNCLAVCQNNIHLQEGDTADLSNFRPISLLSTLYKLLSGVIASRLVLTATELEWVSAEQKGFLPGLHGIQEHTEMLLSAIAFSKKKKSDLSIVFLDLANAFGSLPHAYLDALFQSLPLPEVLKKLLSDIYRSNSADFMVGSQAITVALSSGVRQGDGLSSIVFNLAGEPIIRVVKLYLTAGFRMFGVTLKVLSYADEMTIAADDREILQMVLNLVIQKLPSLVFISTHLSAQHSHKKGGVRQLLLHSTSEKLQSGSCWRANPRNTCAHQSAHVSVFDCQTHSRRC